MNARQKIKKLFIITFIILVASLTQPLFSQTADPYFSLGVNSDAFGGMELGYAHNPGILKEKNLQFYVRFSIPLLRTVKDRAFDTWEIKIGARSELFNKNNVGTFGDIQLFLMHHHQILGEYIPLGMNVRFTPCYHFSEGYLGFQVNWNQIMATHISHSSYVKDTFENISVSDETLLNIHPKDGWYGDTGSHFSFGLEGAWELSRQFTFYGNLGLIKFSSPYSGLFDAMMMGQVPFYGNFRLFYKI